MSKLLREPLLHFFAVGLGLFVLFDLVGEDDGAFDRKVIDVNRDTLLTFVQFRSRAFEPEMATARLNNMSDENLERLVADYVREEALHREALALGMDQNDYIIKRRLIQSIEFITAGFATAGVEVADDELAEYYEANRENYYVEPFVTFTHVFFNIENWGRTEALTMANSKLAELNAGKVTFSDAPRHGDRFLYSLNYVERESAFVASHFGPQMAEAVFALDPDESEWRGPFESPYGLHLVMLPRKAEGRFPGIEEIRDAVRYDAERDAINAQKDKAIQAIVDTYEVRREPTRPLADSAQ